jgi:DNA-binding MarR family transcriptional regulator|tara:strand:+ start:516 stop:965 length:450 start_codon:yes stop_codon:yes gene_type:complete
MAGRVFDLSYQELQLLVTQFRSQEDVITNIHERFLIYEAYKRYYEQSDPYTMKWAEQTLMLSFPKIYSMVQKLIKHGYLKRRQSTDDKRIVFLEATNKLIDGVNLYEDMKLNELNSLGLTKQSAKDRPSLSDFNSKTAEPLRKKFMQRT